MKIAILTNFKNGCNEEDYILARSFAEDGHKVDLLDFPVESKICDFYDLKILKNIWDLNPNTYRDFLENLNLLISKLKKSKCKIINSLDGKLDFEKYGKKIFS